ncbi:DUF898 family protein [Jannaschia seohaensis]|uniref:Uncharacterized protein DUF898 n=1 Tax=Jannaschia seohaensis TaxID=475081 RepID=A0A2Y9ABP6_9RHOB|nr:DUF898 family protein [Jannaschia seohaensis]PWJ20956.1 uncharacterized protein DUF898 [Jannaschia seohaensis]SSA41366.1 protein of unknown function [Jannaschia seohaensis]
MSSGTALDRMSAEVVGSKGALFALVFKTTALTVATLGIYSFWARTRTRRWLWSSLRVGGSPFEYVGQPLEKLMGFVIAAVIVAVYLGLIVMVLIFASLNLFGGPGPGTAAAFGLLLPVYWFAQYRGLRYLLNHTRWRGISFSMTPGAWRYSGLATLWTLLSILSLGLLWPVRQQQLWRFRARNTYYGDDHFRLTIPARRLVPPFLPALAGIWGLAATTYIVGGMEREDYAWLYLLFGPLAVFGWVHWKTVSFRLLASSLAFAGAAGLTVRPATGRVIGIHTGGWLAVGLVLVVALIAALFAFGFLAVSALPQIENIEELDPIWFVLGGLLFYLTFFLGRSALRLVFVTYPLIRHVGQGLEVRGAAEVNAVRKGESSHMHDADGFANLFDMGSGI